MTDSESDAYSGVFPFQNNMIVNARGPQTNVSNFSFRAPLSSTLYNMPRNFERQRYAESVSDQRSMYYRRDRSPMSVRSVYHTRPPNFSQQSVLNGRSGSPVSIRSIDSNATVSAADIAFAFKNIKFSNFDSRVIRAAYHKWAKRRKRRHNVRTFRHGRGNKSDDSGEQGSDSSISSDDCRSVKTSYKENMSINPPIRMGSRFNDYTDTIKEETIKNVFPIRTTNIRTNQNVNNSAFSNHIPKVPTLRDRFKTGFVLPYQRFNSSISSHGIKKNSDQLPENKESNTKQNERYFENNNCHSESNEEIFPEMSSKERISKNNKALRKRNLNSDDDSSLPDLKKTKRTPSIISKRTTETPANINHQTNNNEVNINMSNANTFNFVKPTLPVRKSRSNIQEKLTKSDHSVTELVEPVEPSISPKAPDISQPQVEQSELSQTDVSMRPSFIKRKLFTQKLDIVEKSNVNSDTINSPKNLYNALQKEKNKARKLVSTQSCLNREVHGENNILDLIHKIVPPDCINKTNRSSINQTKNSLHDCLTSKKVDDETWDVTSVLSVCEEDNVSDTFTDEEIFGGDKKSNNSKETRKNILHRKTSNNSHIKTKSIKNSNENVNQAQKLTAVNKVENDKIERTNNVKHHRRTRSSGNINLKEINNTENSKNTTRDCKIIITSLDKVKNNKTNDPNNRPNTKNNSNTIPNTIKNIENVSLTKECTKSVNKINKDKIQNTKTATNTQNTKTATNTKPKATKIVEDNANLAQKHKGSKSQGALQPKPNSLWATNTKPQAMKIVKDNINLAQKHKASKSQGTLEPVTVQKPKSLYASNIVKNSARTFWDTDSESDAEYRVNAHGNRVLIAQSTASNAVEKSNPEFKHPPPSPLTRYRLKLAETSQCLDNKHTDNAADFSRKFNITFLSLRSHRTSSKRKMFCR